MSRNKIAFNPITGELDLVTRIDQVRVEVDFGSPLTGEADFVTVTVPAPWVAATTKLICLPSVEATADHESPIEILLEGIEGYTSNIVPGVGFDFTAIAPNNAFGKYIFNVIGV